MPGAIVQFVEASGSTASTTIAVAITCTSGNFLHVAAISDDATATCADTQGNSYGAEKGSVIEAGIPRRLHHFTVAAGSSGSNTVTVTFGASVSNRQIIVTEISGVASYEAQGTATDTGNNPTDAATASLGTQPGFGIAICMDYQGGTPGVGTGYTSGGVITGGGLLAGRIEYQSFTTTGSKSANFSNAAFNRTATVFALYLEGSPTPDGTLAKTNANDTLAASGAGFNGYTPRRSKSFFGTGSFGAGPFGEWKQGSVTAASGSTGTLAKTNLNDTSSGQATTTVVTSLARTNTNDTSAVSVTTTVLTTLARTNQNDTSAATGNTWPTSVLAKTNADDTLAASGSVGAAASGTLAVTNADDTSAIQITTTVTSSLARTNQDDTSAASVNTTVVTSLARTNVNDTSSAQATTTILSTLAVTNGDDTVNASGSVGSAVSSSLAVTNQNDTLAASGSTTITSTLSVTNLNDTSSISGTTSVNATLSKTNSDDTLVASGTSGTPAAGIGTKLPLTGVGG